MEGVDNSGQFALEDCTASVRLFRNDTSQWLCQPKSMSQDILKNQRQAGLTHSPKADGETVATSTREKLRLDFLDGVRGLAACYVVVFHALAFTGRDPGRTFSTAFKQFVAAKLEK